MQIRGQQAAGKNTRSKAPIYRRQQSPASLTGESGQNVQRTDIRLSDSRNPSGAAGGDLSGNFPNPSVVKVNGGAIPTSQAVVGTDGNGRLIAGSGFTGAAAGGDLAGTYPNPTVMQASASFALVGFSTGLAPTSPQHDYNPPSWPNLGVLRFTQTTALTLTGLQVGVGNGQAVVILNNGNGVITLAFNGGSSIAQNRFNTPNWVDYNLSVGCCVLLVYGAGSWQVISGGNSLVSPNGKIWVPTIDNNGVVTWTSN